jgi:hypothetical protein
MGSSGSVQQPETSVPEQATSSRSAQSTPENEIFVMCLLHGKCTPHCIEGLFDKAAS